MKTLFLEILIGMQIKVEHSYFCACAIMGPIFPSVSVLVIQQFMTFQRSRSFWQISIENCKLHSTS
jgi:hypothetical protein